MNKAMLMGRLTKDPELTYTQTNNTAICRFTLAVDRRFKRDGQPSADFIGIVAWSKTAEFCSKYFSKGLKVVVEGRIETRSWDDQNGNRRYATDVIAEQVFFAESKRDAENNNQYQSNNQQPQGGQSFNNQASNNTNQNQNDDFGSFDDFDDDNDGLPF